MPHRPLAPDPDGVLQGPPPRQEAGLGKLDGCSRNPSARDFSRRYDFWSLPQDPRRPVLSKFPFLMSRCPSFPVKWTI